MQALLRFALTSVSLYKGTSLSRKISPSLLTGVWPRAIVRIACLQLGRIRPRLGSLAFRMHVPACSVTLILLSPAKVCFHSYLCTFKALSWKLLLIPVHFIARRFPLKARQLLPICPEARVYRIGPIINTQILVLSSIVFVYVNLLQR